MFGRLLEFLSQGAENVILNYTGTRDFRVKKSNMELVQQAVRALCVSC